MPREFATIAERQAAELEEFKLVWDNGCRLWQNDVCCEAVSDNVMPGPEWPCWEARYDNDCEHRKRTCRDYAHWPLEIQQVWNFLAELPFGRLLEDNLRLDSTMHGGGLHVTDPGGWLNPHLDYAAHPKLPGRERRLNVIAFLDGEWYDEWGGAFSLYSPTGEVLHRVYPAANRVIVMECNDLSYHGVEEIAGPKPRSTLALYYLSHLRPGVTRQRALFMPRRGKM